ncbi:Cleft lip and palate transmembrane protein 1 [Podosphaera aphanis]|nr:Cleft lip and palate transmembrane protein 1 [Podosphaera aphanis]
MPAAVPAPRATHAMVQNDEGGGIKSAIKSIVQCILLMFGTHLFIKQIMGWNVGGANTPSVAGDGLDVPAAAGAIPPFFMRPKGGSEEIESQSLIPHNIAPTWPQESLLDILITISPSGAPQAGADPTGESVIVVDERAFRLGNYSHERVIDTSFQVPRQVQNNGTLWGHFFIGLSGEQLNPSSPSYNPERSFHFTWPLTHYLTQKKVKKTKNLLQETKDTDDDDEIPTGPIITSHYHPNFTISFIPDTGTVNFLSLNPAIRQYFHLEASGARDATGQHGWYYPVIFVNTFWQLRSHMIPLNSTVTQLPLHINLNNLANWKFNLLASVDEGAKQAARNAAQGTSTPGTGDGSEFEMIKEILIDTNPYLLATTVFVTIFHMVFEMLAFKSDISHYRNKKNNVGISVRSILGNVFMQGVILLYLLDNNENTNWMILFSQGMGIALEFWKITTVVDVRLRPANNIFGYRVAFEDKHVLSETEEKTKEYDAVAFKYLYIIAIPLLLAYAAYSVVYESHKSWYSFVITTLVGSVYAYGFLMMVPSLYINYRLKSVAHMPARAMTYKFLNTFIDDLFAFTIKMPTLHRLATLRDDIIFFVYLYQSWKYKVDYTRVNEFGQGGDGEEEPGESAKTPALPALSGRDKNTKLIDDLSAKENVDDTQAVASGVSNHVATKRK